MLAFAPSARFCVKGGKEGRGKKRKKGGKKKEWVKKERRGKQGHVLKASSASWCRYLLDCTISISEILRRNNKRKGGRAEDEVHLIGLFCELMAAFIRMHHQRDFAISYVNFVARLRGKRNQIPELFLYTFGTHRRRAGIPAV